VAFQLPLQRWHWFSVDNRACNLLPNFHFVFKYPFVIFSCSYCSPVYSITSRSSHYFSFLLFFAIDRRAVFLSCITALHMQFILFPIEWWIHFKPSVTGILRRPSLLSVSQLFIVGLFPFSRELLEHQTYLYSNEDSKICP